MLQGASDAYAAVGIGENSVLNASAAQGPNTITANGASTALLLNHGSRAGFIGDAGLSGDVVAMIDSSITLGTPEFLLPSVVTVEIAGNVQLSEDSAFVTYDGSAITVNGDVTCDDRESSVSLDDEFVANGSVRCTGFSSFDFRRYWRPFWRDH